MDLKQKANFTKINVKMKQGHYSPWRPGRNVILNRNTNRRMNIINVRKLFTRSENKLIEESIILKSSSKEIKCITFDQIPDNDSLPISSNKESEVKTNSSPFILKSILNAPKTTIYPKRSRYKTPFKPTKDPIRYIRKPISYTDREEMLQNLTKRQQTNPNLTLLDCCVLISKSVILDHLIMIPPQEFKAQLDRTGDTIQKAKLMPGSKREVYRLQTGFVKLFANPTHQLMSPKLLQLFHRNCITNVQPNPEMKKLNLLPVEQDSLPDLIPKTKFSFAYDKKIDTNDHVYSKTVDISPISVLKPRKTRSESLDSASLLSRKNAVKIEQIYSDFNENSLDSDKTVNFPGNPVETILTDNLLENDLILEVIEEPIENVQITGDSVQTDEISIDHSEQRLNLR